MIETACTFVNPCTQPAEVSSSFGLYLLIALGIALIVGGFVGLRWECSRVHIYEEEDFE